MNKRIQELIKECEITSTSYFHGRGNITDTYFDREKFAKLIVQEVTNIVLHYTDVDEGTRVAKQHFGVE